MLYHSVYPECLSIADSSNGHMADFQPTIYGTYDGIIHYNSVQLAFIGVRWLIGKYGDLSKKDTVDKQLSIVSR